MSGTPDTHRDNAPTDPTAPTAPEAQESIPMAETAPTAPARATSTPPPALDPWLARMDRIVDLVAIGALTALCLRHQLGGEITAGAIVAVAGVQTGLRQISAARGGPGVGAVGALLLAVGLGAATHAPAVADAARTLGQRGHVRGGLLAVLAVVALAVLGATAQGCGPARETVMRLAPGVPEVSGCAPSTQRCNGAVPEVCSSSGRWWPSLPVRPDGTQRACVSCVVEDGVAGCAL